MPVVSAKKKCCKDDVRCQRCPVLLMRLEKQGYAERESRRRYDVERKVPKKVMVRARAR